MKSLNHATDYVALKMTRHEAMQMIEVLSDYNGTNGGRDWDSHPGLDTSTRQQLVSETLAELRDALSAVSA
jgi:hypothetical protein